MKPKLVAAILLVAGVPALAHRLDEYLQGTIISIEKDHVQAQMTLTPGVAVFPQLIASIDTDSNGIISEAEQRAYAATVLGDLSLAIDGKPLKPQLVSMQFPAIAEMEEGQGQIKLEFKGELPGGGRSRKFTLENRHQNSISVYLVNSIVPRDPNIEIAAQNRNYSQSSYELEYVQNGLGAKSIIALTPIALLILLRMAIRLRRPEQIYNNRDSF